MIVIEKTKTSSEEKYSTWIQEAVEIPIKAGPLQCKGMRGEYWGGEEHFKPGEQ